MNSPILNILESDYIVTNSKRIGRSEKMENPRTIVITGASSGIGAGLARYYSKKGVLLALTGRNLERLTIEAKKCSNLGAEVIYDIVDARNSKEMKKFIDKIENIRPIELLFANAGVAYTTTHTSENKQSKEIEIVSVNLCGVINTITPVLDYMKTRNIGQIAIMSSLAAYIPTPDTPVYGATKAAIKSYGLALRSENSRKGIGITIICPGYVNSLITKEVKKPIMIVNSDKAAKIIGKKIIKNPSIIVFPFTIYFMVLFGSCLPSIVLNKIYSWITVQN